MRKPALLPLVLMLAAAAGPRPAVAVDVLPLPHAVVQPDGTRIELLPRGDEFNVFWELPSGHTVLRDAAGWWLIATLDAEGRLVPGGPVAGASTSVGALRTAAAPRLRPRRVGTGDGELAPVPFGSRAPAPRALAAAGEQQPLLVILVQFANRAPVGATASQFAGHFFTAEKSVRSYFDASLFGRLSVAPVAESHGTAGDGIVGWLPLAMNHPNRGITGSKTATEAQKNQAKNETRKAIKAAIEAADPYVDFAAYDRNHDGALSVWELAVTVIFAGYESSYGGYSATYSPANWGHRWSLGFSDSIGYVGPAVVDGVKVGDSGSAGGYTTFGEWMQSSASNGHKATLGIMVHELGHDILSLPDLYDTDDSDGESAGVGGWCLMASGSWGSAGAGEWIGDTPTALSAWSKVVTGAVDPVELAGAGSATAAPAATSPSVFRFGSGASNEYFLVEYRSPVGFDAGLKRYDSAFAAGGGLLVLHVDDRVDGNGDAAHKRVDVEEADAGTLGYSRLDLDEGDAARGMLYFSGGSTRFADDTNPSAARHGGGASGVVLSGVGAAEPAGIAFSYQAPNPAGYAADSCATALPVTLAPGTPRPISEDPSQAATSPLPRLCTAVSGLAWYRVEPARSGLLTVETSGYDTVAAVLRGSCDALDVAACNDDGVAAGGGSRIANLEVTRGEPVYVVIGRWGTSVVGTLSGSITLSAGAPLQVTALASGGCPRAALALQVGDGSGPLDGLDAASFTVLVDGVVTTPRSFAAAGGGRYDLELWLEGGESASHAVRVEVDADGASGDLELALAEAGTACAGIAAPAETLVIPMAAHLAGSQGTNWRTDVTTSLTGGGAAPADLEIAYLDHGAANPEPLRTVGVELPGGRGIADIAASSFSVASGKGALLVRWQQGGAARLRFASRTYNLLGAGNALGLPAGSTFGQEVPAVPLAAAVQPGATAWITGLAQRSGVARTNVGMVAAGDAGAAVTLDFFAAAGAPLLTWTRALRAWEYLQVDKILQGVAGGVDAASVRIRTTAGSAPLVAYASVVDDVTGDPVTLLPVTSPAAEWFVAMAANLTGLADTNWRSDLAVANPGDAEASVAVTFLQEGRDNGAAAAATPFAVPPRGCVRLTDVVKTLFGRSGVKGALRVSADLPVVVASRTYNLLLAGNSLGLPAGATFGQGVAGIAAGAVIDAGHPGRVPGVVRSADFRSNLGLLDVSGLGCSVTVRFRDAENAVLGTAIARTLRPYEYVQLNNVLATAGVSGDVAAATAEIEVAGAGAVTAYLSVIDARTGDPITIMAER